MKLIRKFSALLLSLALTLALFSGMTVSALEEISFDPSFDETAYTVLSAKDDKVTSLGRMMLCDGIPTFSGGASGVSVAFTGTELWLNIPRGNGQLDLAVMVDGATPDTAKRVKTSNDTGWICLASGLSNGNHTARVVARGTGGWFAVEEVATDGSFTAAQKKTGPVLEIYGDSITEGAAMFEGVYSETYASYGALLGDLLDADTRIASISGGGIVKNEAGNCAFWATGNPYNFYNTFNVANSSLGEYTRTAPDAIVINIGTNDMNQINNNPTSYSVDDFVRTYYDWLMEIHTEFPDAKVVCVLGCVRDDRPGIEGMMERVQNEVVDAANEAVGEEYVYWLEQANCGSYKELGRAWDNLHPDYKTQEYYALQLAHTLNDILALNVTLDQLPPITPNYSYNEDDLCQSHAVAYTSSSNYDQSKSAPAAFDGDVSTYWQGNSDQSKADGEAWLAVELDDIYTITESYVDWNGIYATGTSLIEVSTDGETWTTAASFTATDNEDTVTFAPVDAKYVRLHLYGTSNDKNYWPEVLTFSVFGEEKSQPETTPVTKDQFDEMLDKASYADYFFGGMTRNYISYYTSSNFTDWGSFEAYTDVSIEEVEAFLEANFAIPESLAEVVREDLGYDEAAGVYHIPYAGGFGGMMAEREYVGMVEDNGTYRFYFAKVNYEFLPDELVDECYDEELGYAVYEGNIYEAGPDGFYRIVGYESYGKVHTLEHRNGVARFLLTENYQAEDLPEAFDPEPSNKPEADPGDVDKNGEVTATDLTALARIVGGIHTSADEQTLANADMDGDDEVGAADLTKLARIIGGID